jgi:hypothetical protein
MISSDVAASRDMLKNQKKRAHILDICNRGLGYAVGLFIQHNS